MTVITSPSFPNLPMFCWLYTTDIASALLIDKTISFSASNGYVLFGRVRPEKTSFPSETTRINALWFALINNSTGCEDINSSASVCSVSTISASTFEGCPADIAVGEEVGRNSGGLVVSRYCSSRLIPRSAVGSEMLLRYAVIVMALYIMIPAMPTITNMPTNKSGVKNFFSQPAFLAGFDF